MLLKRILQLNDLIFPATTQATMEVTETQQVLEDGQTSGGVPLQTRLSSQEVLIQGTFNEAGLTQYLPRKHARAFYSALTWRQELHALKQTVVEALAVGEDDRIYFARLKLSVPRIIEKGPRHFDFELQAFNFGVYWEDVTDCVFWEAYLEKSLQSKLFRYNFEYRFNKYHVEPFLLRYLEPPAGLTTEWYDVLEKTVRERIVKPPSGNRGYLAAVDGTGLSLAGENQTYTLAYSDNRLSFRLAGTNQAFTLAGINGTSFELAGEVGEPEEEVVENNHGVVTETVIYFKPVVGQTVVKNTTGKLRVYVTAAFPRQSSLNLVSVADRAYRLENYTHFVLNSTGAYVGSSFANLKLISPLPNIFDSQLIVLYSGVSNPVVKYLSHPLTL